MRSSRNAKCRVPGRREREKGGGGGHSASSRFQDGETYRDRKDLALQSAQLLKSRNPNSVVKLKDLKTGEEIVVALKAAHQ